MAVLVNGRGLKKSPGGVEDVGSICGMCYGVELDVWGILRTTCAGVISVPCLGSFVMDYCTIFL